jgi:hypothetical protein
MAPIRIAQELSKQTYRICPKKRTGVVHRTAQELSKETYRSCPQNCTGAVHRTISRELRNMGLDTGEAVLF